MSEILILSFVADDRQGLVGRLAEVVTEEGGNWLESRMAHLAEKFAGIARIEVPGDRVRALRAALEGLEADGIHLIIEEAAAAGAGQAEAPGSLLTLDLIGPDHPGIVKDITSCLAGRGVSIEEMDSDIRPGPMGGGTFFHARLTVRAPVDLDEKHLMADLEDLSDALMIDITLREEILSTRR